MKKIFVAFSLFMLSAQSFADVTPPLPTPVPEPGILGLLGIGIVALLIARKKK